MLPVMAILLSATVILWAGSHPAQLLFYAARERMTVQNPPATNGDLGRERGVPEPTRTMWDGSRLAEAKEVTEERVPGWAASFGMAHQVRLGI